MRELELSSDVRHLLDHSTLPLVLIFTREDCRHSDAIKRTLVDLEKYAHDERSESRIEVYHFDLERDPALALAFGVEGTPTTFLVRRQYVVQKWVGVGRFHNYLDACLSLLASTEWSPPDGDAYEERTTSVPCDESGVPF